MAGAMAINSVQLLGNVGAKVENWPNTHGTESQVTFSVATDNGANQAPTWHRVRVSGNPTLAKIATTVMQPGDQVTIWGELAYRKFSDGAGTERIVAEVVLGRYNAKLIVHATGRKAPAADREGAA